MVLRISDSFELTENERSKKRKIEVIKKIYYHLFVCKEKNNDAEVHRMASGMR